MTGRLPETGAAAHIGLPDAVISLTISMMAVVARLGKEPPKGTVAKAVSGYAPQDWRKSPFMGFELFMVPAIAADGGRMAIMCVDEVDAAMARLGEPITAWVAGESGGVTYVVARPREYGGPPIIEEAPRRPSHLRLATRDGEFID